MVQVIQNPFLINLYNMKCVFCGTELVLGFVISQDTVEEKQLESEFFCIILISSCKSCTIYVCV